MLCVEVESATNDAGRGDKTMPSTVFLRGELLKYSRLTDNRTLLYQSNFVGPSLRPDIGNRRYIVVNADYKILFRSD